MGKIPESLSAPKGSSTQAKIIADETAVTAAPTSADEGAHTYNSKYLHFHAVCEGGGSFDVKLWGRYSFAEEWGVIEWFGTAGVVTVTNGSPQITEPIVIAGLDEVYAEITAVSGGASANVWLAGSDDEE